MVYVQLKGSWTDDNGRSHQPGDTVDVDAVTLATLQARGVAPDPDGDSDADSWGGREDEGTDSWGGPTGGEDEGTDSWGGPTGGEDEGTDSWGGPTGGDDS